MKIKGTGSDEFIRTCAVCDRELQQGFTDEDVYVCEDHFEVYMNDHFQEWRENHHDYDPGWYGGFYDFRHNESWIDSGFY